MSGGVIGFHGLPNWVYCRGDEGQAPGVIGFHGLPNRVYCRGDEGQVPLAFRLEFPDGVDLSGQHLVSRNGG